MNNWYVLTGAPSSGKTTILNLLEKKGYHIQHEWARIYIDEEIKKGKSLEQIRKDESLFQKRVVALKVNFEKTLPKNKTIFIDRGIPDSAGYNMLYGIKSDTFLTKALKDCFYKKVFLFKLISYEKDYARIENKTQALLIEKFLEKAYKDLGMTVITVPKMTIENRLEFILKNL